MATVRRAGRGDARRVSQAALPVWMFEPAERRRGAEKKSFVRVKGKDASWVSEETSGEKRSRYADDYASRSGYPGRPPSSS